MSRGQSVDFNIKKISSLYGKTVADEIRENLEVVEANIKWLQSLGFAKLDEIFYTYSIAFLQDEETFKRKVFKIISNVGVENLKILEKNLQFWEGLI